MGPNSAVDDVKELPRRIRTELYQVSEEVLVDVPDSSLAEDEQGVADTGLMIRRAARREDMRALASQEDGAEGTPLTVGYWYVYRLLNAAEINHYGGPGYFVCRVVDLAHLAWALQQVQVQVSDP
jgi:hypothetical protein